MMLPGGNALPKLLTCGPHGERHRRPGIGGNILCLCANHHVLLDRGPSGEAIARLRVSDFMVKGYWPTIGTSSATDLTLEEARSSSGGGARYANSSCL